LDKNFWEELIAYFPLIRHGPHRKRKIKGGQTHREQDDLISLKSLKNYGGIRRKKGGLISLILFFKNEENRLKHYNSFSSSNIVTLIKSRRMKWPRHVTRIRKM
jgi:hypothetical protein